MANGKRSTILDVARRAAASTATVLRVRCGAHYPVSEPLRQQMFRAARQLNYKPNLFSRVLKGGSSSREMGGDRAVYRQPFLRPAGERHRDRLHGQGLRAHLCSSQNSAPMELRHLQLLGGKQVESCCCPASLWTTPFSRRWTAWACPTCCLTSPQGFAGNRSVLIF